MHPLVVFNFNPFFIPATSIGWFFTYRWFFHHHGVYWIWSFKGRPGNYIPNTFELLFTSVSFIINIALFVSQFWEGSLPKCIRLLNLIRDMVSMLIILLEGSPALMKRGINWGVSEFRTAMSVSLIRLFCYCSTPQINTWTADWIEFYSKHRLGYQLELASRRYGDSAIYEKGTVGTGGLSL